MQVIHQRCCGLDIHKKTIVACVMLTQDDGTVEKQVRTFASTTVGLLALSDWLESQQVLVVAMESTGIFWRPVFTILEEGRTIILVSERFPLRAPALVINNDV